MSAQSVQSPPVSESSSDAFAGLDVSRATHDPATDLSHIPLFSLMKPEERAGLLAIMSLVDFPAGKTIFWMGDAGDGFYLVNSGSVEVVVPNEHGQSVRLTTLQAGAFFGEISLLDGGPRTATVRTLEHTQLYKLPREAFHNFLLHNPAATIEILSAMGERQRATTQSMRAVKNPNVEFERSHASLWHHACDTLVTFFAGPVCMMLHITGILLWVGVNTAAGHGWLPVSWAFDPFPFGLLTLLVSLDAIALSLFVLVNQNRQADKDRIRNDLDYQVNMKSLTEIMALGQRLQSIESALRKPEDDPSRPSSDVRS